MSYSENINVRNISDTSYGELITASPYAFVSGNPTYGFIPANFRTFVVGAGQATAMDDEFMVSSGTALADYGVIRSFRSVNYKTGQAVVIRFGARFDTPQVSTESGAGAFNLGDEVSVGYSGTTFGLWYRHSGKAEIRDLQITGAAGGSENATVTINGTAYTVPLTSGTVQQNAREIANYLYTNGSGFGVEQIDDTVRIDFTSDGAKTNTFSFSSSTATATWSQVTAGVTKTSEHTAQADWNGQLFDGFDPSKGNCYKIEYLGGYGNIRLYILNPSTSQYDLVHTIENLNALTRTNFFNPSLHVGLYAYQINPSGGTAVDVYMSYITGFVHGVITKTRNPRSVRGDKSSVGTTSTPILAVRCSRTYNGEANQVEVDPTYITLANDGANAAVFDIYTGLDASGLTGYNFQPIGTNLITDIDTSATAHTFSRLITSFTVAKGQSIAVKLSDFDIRVPPGLIILIAGRLTKNSGDLAASLTWYEDI